MKFLWVIVTIIFSQYVSDAVSVLEIDPFAADTASVIENLNKYVKTFIDLVTKAETQLNSDTESYKNKIQTAEQGKKNVQDKFTDMKKTVASVIDENKICSEQKDEINNKLNTEEPTLISKVTECLKDYDKTLESEVSKELNLILSSYQRQKTNLDSLVPSCKDEHTENYQLIACTSLGLEKFNAEWKEGKTQVDNLKKSIKEFITVIDKSITCVEAVAKDKIFDDLLKNIEDYSKCASEASQLPGIPENDK